MKLLPSKDRQTSSSQDDEIGGSSSAQSTIKLWPEPLENINEFRQFSATSPPKVVNVKSLPVGKVAPVKENPKTTVEDALTVKPAEPASPPDALSTHPSWLNWKPPISPSDL